ncbi:zinc-binding alcohol dehydrogenase [Parahaliea maris]|uniref:Zinc-binding alcohol dehydrogenase n=1 Tax=Parahaliea maris TaxID=2716870 RepID=A0A5C8ZPC2_9GAMM|nr:zinc-binding alcohol dehydrogenase [Parahaliea maris]TXS90293.1 zinc-binding alcohol dehydrogenase [Parahaliea maris]
MKSVNALVSTPGKVVLVENEVSEPGPDQVLLRALKSSLSPGTERALMAGSILPLPQVMGYSLTARVEAVGSRVTDFLVGDHVVSTASHSELQLMDPRNLTAVPSGVSLEQASFFNLAHTALYGVRRSGIQLGEPVVVMGQGLVGTIAAMLAKLAGALPVIVTDIDDERLSLSRALGADVIINTARESDSLTQAALDLGGIPVVIEATGLRSPLEEAAGLISERGRLVMMSTTKEATSPGLAETLMMKGASLIGGYVNSKPFALHRSDLEITGTWPPSMMAGSRTYQSSDVWTSEEDIRTFLNLLKLKRLNLDPLISHRFSVDRIPEAYDLVWKRDPRLLGGVIDWT